MTKDAGPNPAAARGVRWAVIASALTLALTVGGCDRCGDFFWNGHPGACKAGPPPS